MNEFVQNINLAGSRLNWDADISLLKEGESKKFLNTVPEESNFFGTRTNCLGTTQATVFAPNTSRTSITVTTTYPTTTTATFAFTLSSVPNILWVEILHNNTLKHLYITGSGYATVTLFCAHVLDVVRKYYMDDLSASSSSATGCSFTFRRTTGDTPTMIVRTITTATYPSTLKVIGTHYDKLDNVIYYWVYDSAGTYFLLQYVCDFGVILALHISGLDVTSFSSVNNAVIFGDNKEALLYWNYYQATAHKINVYNCLTGTGTFTSVSTNLIKPPVFTYYNMTRGTGIYAYNNYNKYYIALIRNRFDDNEASAFGGLFDLFYPYFGETPVGTHGVASNHVYNIDPASDTHPEWDKCEYAITSGNNEWYLIDSSLMSSAGVINGSEIGTTLAPSDINRLFDYVPQKIGSLESMSNNRLVLSDCTEGYGNVAIVATASVITSTPSIYSLYKRNEVLAATYAYIDLTTVWEDYSDTQIMYIKTNNGEYYIYLHDTYGTTVAQRKQYFADYITDNIIPIDPDITSVVVPGTGFNYITVNTASTALLPVPPVCMSARAYPKQRTFPNGINYLGIVYYDQFGRCGGVNVDDELSVEVDANVLLSQINLVVTNTPPEWAYYYRIFYGGCNKQKYQQLAIKSSDVVVDGTYTKIFINNCILAGQEINEEFNIGSYVFTPGDRIRFLRYSTNDVDDYTVHSPSNSAFTNTVDLEIFGQDETYIYIANIIDATTLTEMAASGYYLVEIYTPQIHKPIEYFETRYWGTIRYPGTASRSHTVAYGSTYGIPGSISTNICRLEGFDHMLEQVFYIDGGIPVVFNMISESFSNYFDSKTRGLGRVNFYSPDFVQLRRNVLRASNVYLPNTNINGLSTFEYANEVVVDETHGPITDIKLVGDVIKVVQPHKLSSIYLGAQVGTDASGQQILLRSDRILSEPRYNALTLGCIHPESIVVHNGYMYAFDAINSVVWRDTPGGTFMISDNGMRSYFKYKVQQLVASCGYSFKAYGGYDYINETYLLTFVDPYNSSNNETIGFYEPGEYWSDFYSFVPEMYQGIQGDHLITYKNGRLYTHDNATRNNFYGTQYNSEAWVVANQYPNDTKKFNTIYVNSNDVWAPSATDGIIVDSDHIAYQDGQNYTTHKGAMQSSLKEANFRIYNGEYRAEFLRDATTNSSTFSVDDLINGRALQGKTIIVKLINDHTSGVHLRSVRIGSQTVR